MIIFWRTACVLSCTRKGRFTIFYGKSVEPQVVFTYESATWEEYCFFPRELGKNVKKWAAVLSPEHTTTCSATTKLFPFLSFLWRRGGGLLTCKGHVQGHQEFLSSLSFLCPSDTTLSLLAVSFGRQERSNTFHCDSWIFSSSSWNVFSQKSFLSFFFSSETRKNKLRIRLLSLSDPWVLRTSVGLGWRLEYHFYPSCSWEMRTCVRSNWTKSVKIWPLLAVGAFISRFFLPTHSYRGASFAFDSKFIEELHKAASQSELLLCATYPAFLFFLPMPMEKKRHFSLLLPCLI